MISCLTVSQREFCMIGNNPPEHRTSPFKLWNQKKVIDLISCLALPVRQLLQQSSSRFLWQHTFFVQRSDI